VRAIIARGVKERDESAVAYAEAGRDDLAAVEIAQRAVLAAYLPEPLTDDEVVGIVEQVIAEHGFEGRSDMGPAMKAVRAVIAGRADGKVVAAAVTAALSS
jgi:uncharacterized protein YqeY